MSTFTRLQAFCSQIVTLKILNSSPCFGVDRHFYKISPSTTSWTTSEDANFYHQSLTGRKRSSSLHWRNFGVGNGRERVYTCWSSGCYIHPGWSSDVFEPLWRKVQRQAICSDSLQSRNAKYLLWKARTSGANLFGHFLFIYFLFLKSLLRWHVP